MREARRARPPDAHLHARRRQRGDEPRRRLARLEARSACGRDGRRGRAQLAPRLGGRPGERVQNELFDLGADLSVPYAAGDDRLRVTQDAVDRLEGRIDEANAALPELKSFVLPGGSERAARLFLARAVCRRAERAVLAVPDTESARRRLPEPALRPPVRPRPCRQPRGGDRRAALAARREELGRRSRLRCDGGHGQGEASRRRRLARGVRGDAGAGGRALLDHLRRRERAALLARERRARLRARPRLARARIRSPAASTRRCTAGGSGRCASSPASARPRRRTRASATCSSTARRASRRPSTCRR